MSADERTHAALERAARSCVPTATSTLQNGVSVHRFGESVSFTTLRALMLAAEVGNGKAVKRLLKARNNISMAV